mmetsp:Transcript_62601/g.150973  ORF Transcript_62601/g.150973 Transcript_62601/m.150973 type:complete len:256 (-) Transcript_62601:342-1109(-)
MPTLCCWSHRRSSIRPFGSRASTWRRCRRRSSTRNSCDQANLRSCAECRSTAAGARSSGGAHRSPWPSTTAPRRSKCGRCPRRAAWARACRWSCRYASTRATPRAALLTRPFTSSRSTSGRRTTSCVMTTACPPTLETTFTTRRPRSARSSRCTGTSWWAGRAPAPTCTPTRTSPRRGTRCSAGASGGCSSRRTSPSRTLACRSSRSRFESRPATGGRTPTPSWCARDARRSSACWRRCRGPATPSTCRRGGTTA